MMAAHLIECVAWHGRRVWQHGFCYSERVGHNYPRGVAERAFMNLESPSLDALAVRAPVSPRAEAIIAA